jgi:CHAD domain-containing protein
MAKASRYGAIGPEEPVESLANAVLRSLWDAMCSESEAALNGHDVEAVHDMRVAIRRLRNALHTFRHCYHRKRMKRLRRTIGTLGRALGAVRDADVHLEVLNGAVASAAEPEREGLTFAIERVAEARGSALAATAALWAALDRDALARALTDG